MESYENDKKSLSEKYAREADALRRECARQIQHAKEDIENRKQELSRMSDKELLANVMIALNGYGSRLDRLEQHLTDDQITARMSRLLQDVTVKIQGITETLTGQINEMNESIQDSLNDSDLKSRLDSMGDNLDEMASDIEEIKSSVGDGSSSNYDISDIKSKVEEIHESVCDKYNYDSVARGIDDLLSAVNEMKDTAEYAKRAAEEAKDAAENAQRAAEEAKDAAESR
jgi:uncharacterized protein YoxC